MTAQRSSRWESKEGVMISNTTTKSINLKILCCQDLPELVSSKLYKQDSNLGVFLKFLFYLFIFFATGHGIGELSSATKDRTHAPVVEARSLNHRTTREAPDLGVLRAEWELGNCRWKRDRGKAVEKLTSSRWERELRPGPTHRQVNLSLDLLSKKEIRLEHVHC